LPNEEKDPVLHNKMQRACRRLQTARHSSHRKKFFKKKDLQHIEDLPDLKEMIPLDELRSIHSESSLKSSLQEDDDVVVGIDETWDKEARNFPLDKRMRQRVNNEMFKVNRQLQFMQQFLTRKHNFKKDEA